ncbi:MAG: type II toxin-antitoxin system VapC family toxin [Acidobacteria bacterium]|nr:type II toxin-antitoxin system VapC family toxin [Acidobacteriota bacterium]
MRLLLDTHAFLWWIQGGTELSGSARKAIGDSANTCWLSMASAWEMAIKIGQGKLKLEADLARFLPEHLAANGFTALPIAINHVSRVAQLPYHHRDPFDRLIIAQALEDGLSVVSADKVFSKYRVRRIW